MGIYFIGIAFLNFLVRQKVQVLKNQKIQSRLFLIQSVLGNPSELWKLSQACTDWNRKPISRLAHAGI